MSLINIDLFCGGGGASEGIEMAGLQVHVAVNHDPVAIALHRVNHPRCTHYLQDVFAVDPRKAVPAGAAVNLLWCSAACTHFSRARGAATPLNAKIRDLATVVTERWIPALGNRAPRVIIVENVPEFESWGPLDDKGRPDKARRGELFMDFVVQLHRQGYGVEWRVLDAARYGIPTSRRRLFLVARRDGCPVAWPRPVPGRVPVRTVIDWTDQGLPVDMSAEEIRARWGVHAVRPLSRNTLGRIDRQAAKMKPGEPYLVKYYGTGGGQSVDEPLATVTTHDRFMLIQHSPFDGQRWVRMLTPRELASAMGFPAAYILDHDAEGTLIPKTKQVAAIGNAVCPPLAAAIVRANLGGAA